MKRQPSVNSWGNVTSAFITWWTLAPKTFFSYTHLKFKRLIQFSKHHILGEMLFSTRIWSIRFSNIWKVIVSCLCVLEAQSVEVTFTNQLAGEDRYWPVSNVSWVGREAVYDHNMFSEHRTLTPQTNVCILFSNQTQNRFYFLKSNLQDCRFLSLISKSSGHQHWPTLPTQSVSIWWVGNEAQQSSF